MMITALPRRQAVATESAHRLESSVALGLRPFMELEAEWRELLQVSESRNPFLAWGWVSAWVQSLCRERLVTVTVRSGSRTVAIAPFYRREYAGPPGLRATALQLFGPREANVLFEVREVLRDPAHAPGVFAALIEALERHGGWDWLELSASDADTQGWESLPALVSPSATLLVDRRNSIPLMRLEATWDEQRKVLKRNIKESIRHCYNSLQREGHSFSVHVAGTDEERARAIDDLLHLHHLRSTVEDRYRHRDHFRPTAFRTVMHEALRSSGARLFTLRIDGAVAAVRATFDVHRQRYLYYSGFDPAWWKYGVMTLLVTEILKDAIANGMDTVNFSPGVDVSKTRWGSELKPIHNYHLLRSRRVSRRRYQIMQWSTRTWWWFKDLAASRSKGPA